LNPSWAERQLSITVYHCSPEESEAKASDVETVVINGKIIRENGKLATLKVERVMAEVEEVKNKLGARLNVNVK